MSRLFTSILIDFARIAITLLFSLNLYAQQKGISGTVKDPFGQPLSGATVSLLNNEGLVINYTFTNQNGYFELIPSSHSLSISVSYLGYKKVKIKLDAAQSTYSVQLEHEAKLLKEVLVKTRPATELLGDTLKYFVKKFATEQDRTIADVLRRLPGLEITQDGSIYFNGKKIKNLYIEGDDLMDGRYGMAVKIIKKELIESIDIIKHHQPIAVVKDKVFTDDVAINLVLQDESSLKLSTTAQIGTGIPAQMEASIAPILLSKKLKTVNRIAYNSTGTDYRNDLKQLGSQNFVEDVAINRKDVALSLASISPPDIPLNYYYLNRSAVFNLNTLFKNKKGVQFKLNSSSFIDKNHLGYEGRTTNYLIQDTITYQEQQLLSAKPILFNIGISLMINKSRYFLNNSFKASLEKETFSGLIGFNGSSFSQKLAQQSKEFSNDINWIPALKGRGIAELRWHASYSSKLQRLDIGNGYYFDISPQEGYYETVTQQVRSPLLFHNAYMAYKLPGKKIYQEYKLGHRLSHQLLKSDLKLMDGSVPASYANDHGNNLLLHNNSAYLLARYQLKINNLRSDVQLPLSLLQIRSSQPDYTSREQQRVLLFLPSVNITYNFDNEKYLQASYRLQNTFNNIANSYMGSILLNYRALQAYATGLQREKAHQSNVVYYHQKSIKLFYFNIGLSYDHVIASSILSDSFSSNIRRINFVPYQNTQKTLGMHAGLSQYLFGLKTKVGLKVQRQRAFYMQFVNHELLNFQFNDFSVSTSANKKIGKVLDVNHQAYVSWAQTRLSDKNKSLWLPGTKSFYFDQRIKTSLRLLKGFYIETAGAHRINRLPEFNRTGFFFLDANIKKLGIAKGMDLELNCLNLLNVKNYMVFLQNGNQTFTSSYPLRGRTFFIRANYSF
jgi:hypothetical protein